MENASPSTIKGTGVVAGVAYAEAVWVRPRPELPTAGETIAEENRDAEYDRFLEAVDIVASRLEQRAAGADGQAGGRIREQLLWRAWTETGTLLLLVLRGSGGIGTEKRVFRVYSPFIPSLAHQTHQHRASTCPSG